MRTINVIVKPTDASFKKLFRSKKARNKGVRITVKGEIKKEEGDKYSKYTGDAYRLAEIHTYGLHGPKRPFLTRIREEMKKGEYADRLKEKVRTSTDKKTLVTDWDKVGKWVVGRAKTMMKNGRLNLVPLKKETLDKKKRYGYGKAPLYASGELAKCITWEMV